MKGLCSLPARHHLPRGTWRHAARGDAFTREVGSDSNEFSVSMFFSYRQSPDSASFGSFHHRTNPAEGSLLHNQVFHHGTVLPSGGLVLLPSPVESFAISMKVGLKFSEEIQERTIIRFLSGSVDRNSELWRKAFHHSPWNRAARSPRPFPRREPRSRVRCCGKCSQSVPNSAFRLHWSGPHGECAQIPRVERKMNLAGRP